MKRTISFIIAACALLLAGCAKNGLDAGRTDAGLRLVFKTPGADCVKVRAEVPGENAYNENLLNSIYYFLYPKDDTGEAVVHGYAAGISKTGTYTETVPVSADDLNNKLFNGSHECSLFAVANPPASLVSMLEGTPTLAQLRTATVLSSLDGTQDNFVMVYDGGIEISSHSSESAVTADVGLSRLACKFTINAHVAQYVDDEVIKDGSGNSVRWYPVIGERGNGLNVSIGNLLNRTTLGGFDKASVTADDYFESIPIDLKPVSGTETVIVEGVTYNNCKGVQPVYSYPMEWEFTDRFEPYLMFELTWTYNDGEKDVYQPRYYKLMLGQRSITSNDWYDITAKLTVLGSMARKDPTVQYLYLDYQVLGWTDAYDREENPNTPAEIKDSRYLVVPQTEWNLYNQNEVKIPFSSSHECEIYIKSGAVTQKKYSTVEGSTKTIPVSTAKTWFTVDMANSNIVFSHDLVNEIGSDMDYTPYNIEAYVVHKDENITTDALLEAAAYKERLVITQYPSMYIDCEVSGNKATGGNTANPTLFINGRQNTSSTGNVQWDHVHTGTITTTGANSNYNMIVLSLTVLDDDFGIIGDPRSHTPLNSTQLNAMDATTGANRIDFASGLNYYYRAGDDEMSKRMIAPKLRINSAHGQTDSNRETLATATERCASYQQDGYPAGRWRLPTNAEMEFMAEMCAQGVIPALFADNYYWTATDLYQYNSTSKTATKRDPSAVTATNLYCRCVYDEWYWDEIDHLSTTPRADRPYLNTFHWGDQEITW